jgi:hypothetical protein
MCIGVSITGVSNAIFRARSKMKKEEDTILLRLPYQEYSYLDLMAASWYQRFRKGIDSPKTYLTHVKAMIAGIELRRKKVIK